ncbi:MAG TPA: hypothetical protein VFG30_04885 [Polyangiales bacterium]|nr:hypothetical protein [Polyangiales bacterium]
MRCLPLLRAGVLLALGLAACSADEAARGTAGPNPGANSGGSLARVDNPMASLPTGSNPTGVVPIMPVTMNTGGTSSPGNSTSAPVKPHDPISIDQTGANNPAGVPDADVKKLIAGGAPGALKWLYPYDGTVFPRGLLAPLLMWDGPAADVVYLRIKSQSFEYKGVLKAGADAATMLAPQLTIPQDIWVKAGQQTNGKNDPFTLELTVRAAGAVSGPIKLTFNLAQATVKGSIYYNSYASKLPGAAIGGNVLRIPAGGTVELFNSMQCNGCHSVSADGSKMLSQIDLMGGGSAYTLVSGGPANPPGAPAGPRTSYGALYPDGSKYLSTTTSTSVGHAELAQPVGAPPQSALYDTTTGQEVPNTGIPPGALMPMFSPDGTKLVFNDVAISNASGLAVMDYDVSAHKASNYRMLMTDTDGTRPGWPFMLPDSKGVVFVRTISPDFSANGAYIGAGAFAAFAGPFADLAMAPIAGPPSDLFMADVATGTVVLLAKAMGFNTPQDATSGNTYLPFPDDVAQSYFPTVAPIAAGGYFWVFFDSIRHYGNLGTQRQLWGFAIDIQANGSYTTDLSHPAFYLPGQEFGAGNHRAFAALDPCKRDGDSCTSGIDCCGGACTFPPVAAELVEPMGTCNPPPVNTCAKRDEKCATDADCCPPASNEPPNACIAGFCAFVPLN